MLIIINFKNYKKGKQVLDLAIKIQKYLPNSIVAVPSPEIKEVSSKTKLKVYSQYYYNNTNSGTLLNHSEHKLSFSVLKKQVEVCKKLKLKTLVFASNINEARRIMKLKPTMLAYEDSKLIGTGKSITSYKTNEVKEFAKLLKGKKIIPLCGAGISNKEDIQEARRLGCKGVVISSAIANSKFPNKILKSISE
ncbi:MAG: triose-phosphate isomerase [Nanoarchaeota archaeon]|nr:triose-phosphate isomerase [Nanoarchaeota archaeon]